MEACSFDESNAVLGHPKGWTADQCNALSVAVTKTDAGAPVIVSCWKLTKDEAEEFARTGRVWLYIWGDAMPPVALTAKHPFK